MTKWFIEAPNSILDTEKAFLEKGDLAVTVRFRCLEKKSRHPILRCRIYINFNIQHEWSSTENVQDSRSHGLWNSSGLHRMVWEELLYGT